MSSVAAVIIHRENLLLVRPSKKNGRLFGFPHSGVKRGESPELAAIRTAAKKAGVYARIKGEPYKQKGRLHYLREVLQDYGDGFVPERERRYFTRSELDGPGVESRVKYLVGRVCGV